MLKTEAYDRKQRLQKRVLAYQDSLPLERRSPFIIAAEKEAIKDHEKFKVYHQDLSWLDEVVGELQKDRDNREKMDKKVIEFAVKYKIDPPKHLREK